MKRRILALALLLVADVGLRGLPNAVKSTFIRAVSAARPKVADYPFTTLVPNLGVVKTGNGESFVIADVPGLIEGASEGAGLGHRFLRHLERCRVLLHLVDAMPVDGSDPARNAQIIEQELKQYAHDLFDKPRYLVLNKADLVSKEEAQEILSRVVDALEVKPEETFIISALKSENLNALLHKVQELVDKVKEEERQSPEKAVTSEEFVWTEPEKKVVLEEGDNDFEDEGPEFIYRN